MSLFRKLAGMLGGGLPTAAEPAAPRNDQAVIVEVQVGQSSEETMADLLEFEDRLSAAVESSGMGEFDGNEIATDGSHARFYIYAANADDLLGVVGPLFLDEAVVKDATFLLRYGEADDPQAREVTLSLEQVRKIYGGV